MGTWVDDLRLSIDSFMRAVERQKRRESPPPLNLPAPHIVQARREAAKLPTLPRLPHMPARQGAAAAVEPVEAVPESKSWLHELSQQTSQRPTGPIELPELLRQQQSTPPGGTSMPSLRDALLDVLTDPKYSKVGTVPDLATLLTQTYPELFRDQPSQDDRVRAIAEILHVQAPYNLPDAPALSPDRLRAWWTKVMDGENPTSIELSLNGGGSMSPERRQQLVQSLMHGTGPAAARPIGDVALSQASMPQQPAKMDESRRQAVVAEACLHGGIRSPRGDVSRTVRDAAHLLKGFGFAQAAERIALDAAGRPASEVANAPKLQNGDNNGLIKKILALATECKMGRLSEEELANKVYDLLMEHLGIDTDTDNNAVTNGGNGNGGNGGNAVPQTVAGEGFSLTHQQMPHGQAPVVGVMSETRRAELVTLMARGLK